MTCSTADVISLSTWRFFSWHFPRSSISNVSFSVLTKRSSPVLLLKVSESYAVIGKWIKCIYVNFGVYGPLRCLTDFHAVWQA